ncbi:Matrix metalloproteinase-14, partial [Cyphomyrmex costatus]
CDLPYVDNVLVLKHNIFVTYRKSIWVITINGKRYKGPLALNDYLHFLPANVSINAVYQRPSEEIVMFANNKIYMVDYPSFQLKNGWPKTYSDLNFPAEMRVNAALVTNRGQTYVIFDGDSVALMNECDMTIREYHSLKAIFPGIPSSPTAAYRYIDGSLHFLQKRQYYKFNETTVRILERRYPLTATGYKYLTVGINVKLPCEITVVLGDSHGKEMFLSPTVWSELIEHKRVILSLLQPENTKGKHAPSPIYIGDVTLHFGRINSIPMLRLDSTSSRMTLSNSTVVNLFNLEYCVNRLISSFDNVSDIINKKYSRLLNTAANVNDSTNIQKTMYENEYFDRNDIIDCELIALIFGPN